ncbi:SDR family NAD(P)-dependent oxidoreductase [Mycobacterium sp.]|uniref:SDR family NAD(P)-dependent oxidoreductase n=1 Tax=Mycobacterium sp. TaxID=1785 RepID=UPI003F98EAF7
MKDLRDRVAVVTGAANGIGLGLATRFLKEGMDVVIADKATDDLARAEESLRPLGNVLAVETDVSDRGSVQGLADASVDRFGAVHVLCNNAGVGEFRRFDTTSLATWDWTVGVNLFGVLNGCRIFLPILARQEEAYIVNTASMSGILTGPYLEPYSVSKAGVVSLSESLAAEFAIEYPHIGVAVLCPSYTATSIRHDEQTAPIGHVARATGDPGLEELREPVNSTIEQQGICTDEIGQLVIDGMANRKTYIFPRPRLASAMAAMGRHRHGGGLREDYGWPWVSIDS